MLFFRVFNQFYRFSSNYYVDEGNSLTGAILPGVPDIWNLVDGWLSAIFTFMIPDQGLKFLGIIHVFLLSAAQPLHLSIAPLNWATISPFPSCSVSNRTSKFRRTLP